MTVATVRVAVFGDEPGITVCVCDAYAHVAGRSGARPAPAPEDRAHPVRGAQCMSQGREGELRAHDWNDIAQHFTRHMRHLWQPPGKEGQ